MDRQHARRLALPVGGGRARAFVADEPYARAGPVRVPPDVRRFSDLLGRTMWEQLGLSSASRRYLVFARDDPGRRPPPDRLLMSGELRTLDGEPRPASSAAARGA